MQTLTVPVNFAIEFAPLLRSFVHGSNNPQMTQIDADGECDFIDEGVCAAIESRVSGLADTCSLASWSATGNAKLLTSPSCVRLDALPFSTRTNDQGRLRCSIGRSRRYSLSVRADLNMDRFTSPVEV